MASFTVPSPKAGSGSLARLASAAKNLPRSATQTTSLSFGFQGRKTMRSTIRKVNAASSSNSVAMPSAKPVIKEQEDKKPEAPKEITTESKNIVPDAESVSAFMTQVSDLIKLVDSRDIVELHMKQLDCEVTIRKKEALEPPQVYSAFPSHATYSSLSPPPPPQQATAGPASPASLPAPAPAKPAKSGHPPLKSPMPGTFYRCPAPGEPPFVKVGDKVQKGQVVCIIEAMKLMNEIEADQSGTVVEIVAEDGKPVSVDTPLFVIAP